MGSRGAFPRLVRCVFGRGLIHRGRDRGQDLVRSGRSRGHGLVCRGRNLRHDLFPRGRDHGPDSCGRDRRPWPCPPRRQPVATAAVVRRANFDASCRFGVGTRGPSRGGGGPGRGVARRAQRRWGKEGRRGEGTPPQPRAAVSREEPPARPLAGSGAKSWPWPWPRWPRDLPQQPVVRGPGPSRERCQGLGGRGRCQEDTRV